MAYSTITNLSNSLRRTYADRYFRAFQNDFTPLLDELDECPDEPTRGVGWFFPFYMASPQNTRVSAEGGPMGTTQNRSELQGQVNAVEFIAWLQISELLKNAGTKDAAWNGGELNRQMKEATTDVTKFMQRMFSISHGTGRLSTVLNNTVASNTVVCANPEGVTSIMRNDVLDAYTLDVGGVPVQTQMLVTFVNRITRTLTLNGLFSLNAGNGLYKTGDYGRGSQGIQGLIDDGTFQDNLFGQSRAANPDLKSKVLNNGGTPIDLTEDQMRQITDQIYLVGGEIDRIWCNVGVLNGFFNISTGNRRYNIEKGQTPKFVLGYREGDALFSYDKGTYVVSKNPNLQARSMYFVSLKQSFYKHTLKKLGWLDEGGSILRLTPSTTAGVAFDMAWTAIIYSAVNISCFAPPWNGRRDDIKDTTLAGDV